MLVCAQHPSVGSVPCRNVSHSVALSSASSLPRCRTCRSVVHMHRQLLELYSTNEARHNHCCVSFLKRLCTCPVSGHRVRLGQGRGRANGGCTHGRRSSPDSWRHRWVRKASSPAESSTSGPSYVATLEPMLYNVRFLDLFTRIAGDTALRSPHHDEIRDFAR